MTPHTSSILKPALLALVGSPLLAVNSFGFAEVARGALTLDTELRLTYDSYFIGADIPGDDDYFASLRPTLRYVRRAGLAEITGDVGVAIMRYDTHDRYDSEDLNAKLRAELPFADGARLSGFVDLTYSEATRVDYDVMDRVRAETYRASINFQYKLGVKTSLTERFSYGNTDRSGYSDQEIITNNLGFVYSDFLHGTSLSLNHGYTSTTSSGLNARNAELDQTSNSFSASLSRPIAGPLRGTVTAGYRILDRAARETDIGQTEIKGAFYSATLSGPFLPPSRFPKVQSSASITYQESESPGINDTGQKTLTGDMSLSWQARERTDVSLSANRSVNLTASDLSVETTRATVAVNQRVGIATSLSASLSYVWRDYSNLDRSDNTLDFTLSGGYQLTRYWSFGASYTYEKNDTSGSDSPIFSYRRMRATDYDRHLASVFVRNLF